MAAAGPLPSSEAVALELTNGWLIRLDPATGDLADLARVGEVTERVPLNGAAFSWSGRAVVVVGG